MIKGGSVTYIINCTEVKVKLQEFPIHEKDNLEIYSCTNEIPIYSYDDHKFDFESGQLKSSEDTWYVDPITYAIRNTTYTRLLLNTV